MKYLLIGVSVSCLTLAGCSDRDAGQPTTANDAASKSETASPPSNVPIFSPALLDLGPCVEGEVLSGVVTLTNPGSDAITLSKIDASCGCSSAGNVAGPVNANQSRRVPITVRTKGKSGDFRGTFFVNYEQNGVAKKCSFEVKAVIRTPGRILATPANVNLAGRKPGGMVQTSIELSPEDLSDPTKLPSIVRIEAPDWLQTNLLEQPDATHKWKLELTGAIPNTAGTLNSVVQVFTDCERFPVCRIPITADVAGVFKFESKSIVKVVQKSNLPIDIPVRLTLADGQTSANIFRSIELAGFEGAELDVSTSPFAAGVCTALVTLRAWNQTTNRVIKGEVVAKGIVDGQSHSASLPVILVLSTSETIGDSAASE